MYCKVEIDFDKKMCKDCRRKYNQIYYEVERGTYLILYYHYYKLIRVVRKYRVTGIFKDRKLKEYLSQNNIKEKDLIIKIVDVSKEKNQDINKLKKYIEFIEDAKIRNKNHIILDGKIKNLYLRSKKDTYHLGTFKAFKKEYRNNLIKSML